VRAYIASPCFDDIYPAATTEHVCLRVLAALVPSLALVLLAMMTAAVALGEQIDAGQIAFSSGRSGNDEIYLLDLRTRYLFQLTHFPTDEWLPTWSPDGRQIAFESDRYGGGAIDVMSLDHHDLYRLPTDTILYDMFPDWSPDGQRIAFFNGITRLAVYDLASSTITNLSSLGEVYNSASPTWSPDGTRILFQSNRNGNYEIYVADADGENLRRLTDNPGPDYTPDWSPDGRHIVFVSERFNGNPEIYVMDADGANVRRLTETNAANNHPDWSPDGKRIVFSSRRSGDQEIYVMDADGGSVERLTNSPGNDWFPAWRP
jgi:Tol biopolymer transport system component